MSEPRILLYDLETSPNVGYTWGKYDQTVMRFTRQSVLLSVAFKWLDDDDVTVWQLNDYVDYDPSQASSRWCDYSLTCDLFELMDEADVVVAHNAKGFDNKKATGRFLFHDLGRPSDYETVDTLQICRNKFKLNSNKLDDVADLLDLGRKKATGGLDTWLNIIEEGCEESWEVMRKYAAQDIVLLEQVYNKLRPWITSVNFNIFDDEGNRVLCPTCGSHHVKRNGTRRTKTRKYQRYQCNECGSWFQSGKSQGSTETKV